MTNAMTVEEWEAYAWKLARLLIECRDALPAISLTSARLHGIDMSLADRIESAIERYRCAEGEEGI
jgi:hypothetical protein